MVRNNLELLQRLGTIINLQCQNWAPVETRGRNSTFLRINLRLFILPGNRKEDFNEEESNVGKIIKVTGK